MVILSFAYLYCGRFVGILIVSGLSLVGDLGAGKLGVGGIGVLPGVRGRGGPRGVWLRAGWVGSGCAGVSGIGPLPGVGGGGVVVVWFVVFVGTCI